MGIFVFIFSIIIPMKEFTPDGFAVVVIKFTNNLAEFDPDMCIRRAILTFDISYKYSSPGCGYILVIDTSSFTLSHSLRIPISYVRKSITCFLVSATLLILQ